ncbi:MAG TPA: IS66 family transposase [Steroidobacteraceae bacterium]|jgi:transposase|nr:IS66 family transposase [Steroidobacteraceae bacterium]
MDDSTKPSDASADARDDRIAQLERQLAAALKRIAELEEIINRLQRGNKRQAAPFSKGLPKLDPKRPGRKSGDGYGTPPVFRAMPEPSPADQVIDVPPPDACPHCGDRSATVESIDQQVQRDIEVRTVVRRFKIAVARCACCGRRRRGSHPLQTSTATGCCASQVGPLARSAMVFMNKTLGLSLGKVANLFDVLWGLQVTPGGVSHAVQSVGRRCKTDYRAIVNAVRKARHVTCDETGWRIGGLGAWLHAAATPDLCAYLIDAARGSDATDKLVGDDFDGTLIHDGWKSYDRYSRATHQQCNTHLLRRCGEMIEAATPGAARFPATVKSILKRGLLLRDERDAGRRSLRSAKVWATRLTGQIRKLCKRHRRNRANERLAAFLYRHAGQLFTYLRDPETDAANWRGEHAMRYAVVNRKVWGGNRTRRGADNQAILMSVLRTLKLRGADAIGWLQEKLLDRNPVLLA